MRRLVLVFTMLLLPLQWSWAAAASVCGHESGNSHFGHHEHQHAGAAAQADAEDPPDEAPGDHPDCHACHGIGAACIGCVDGGLSVRQGDPPLPEYGRALPEPPVDNLLRPPLPLVRLIG